MSRILELPQLHSGQRAVMHHAQKYNVICAGRRWGKSVLLTTIGIKDALRKKNGRWGNVGVFTPNYRFAQALFDEFMAILGDTAEGNKSLMQIRIIGAGQIDFWTLNPPQGQRSGRGRSYSTLILDEASFAFDDDSENPDTLSNIFYRSLIPTIVDRPDSQVWVASTPNGRQGFFFNIFSENTLWQKFHAPSSSNPFLPAAELEQIRLQSNPLVWQQEFLADFVSFDGAEFLPLDLMLNNGDPYDLPCTPTGELKLLIFAVADTSFGGNGRGEKTDSDGTAFLICGLQPHAPDGLPRVFLLDWGIEQITSHLLSNYFENIISLMEDWANKSCYPQAPMLYVEDAGAGRTTLQQMGSLGLRVDAIPSKMMSVGKDSRVLTASRYLNLKQVCMTQHALQKKTSFKNRNANHLVEQITNYKINDPKRHTRSDDLTDAFSYAVMLGCGNQRGF